MEDSVVRLYWLLEVSCEPINHLAMVKRKRFFLGIAVIMASETRTYKSFTAKAGRLKVLICLL